GRREDYERAAALELEVRRIYSDSGSYDEVGRLRASDSLTDPLLRRQLDRLHLAYLENQVPPEITESIVHAATEAESLFNTHRGRIGEREATENEIREVLRGEARSDVRREAWEASKQVGSAVAPLVRQAARARNQAARRLGFADYYALSLALQEQDATELGVLFDELAELTEQAFRAAKAGMDRILSQRYGTPAGELMPWHYSDPFFQEAPPVLDFDLDAVYRGRDVVALAGEFFRRVGLPADDVLARSDLYEKPGKDQHAFCLDIDRRGDVRVLANVRPSERWMETMLHELGHAVYDTNLDPALPYLLREAAHTFTTEAVAMFFGRRAKSAEFARLLLGLPDARAEAYGKAGRRMLLWERVVFCRWTQVMMRFERALYADPEQDLQRLWWDLVERYQGLRRTPGEGRCDWAAKIHLTTNPVYYHNYMLGEMMASQLQRMLAREAAGVEGPEGD
ncbi:MAG: M2 family metallopeptidase, partial [Thermoanaerobaculia bacterium]